MDILEIGKDLVYGLVISVGLLEKVGKVDEV